MKKSNDLSGVRKRVKTIITVFISVIVVAAAIFRIIKDFESIPIRFGDEGQTVSKHSEVNSDSIPPFSMTVDKTAIVYNKSRYSDWENIMEATITFRSKKIPGESKFHIGPGYYDTLVFLFFEPDTVYVVLNREQAIKDYIKDLKEGPLKIIYISKGYLKDKEGILYERMSFPHWKNLNFEDTPIDMSQKKYVFHPKLSGYDYMIAVTDFDKIWIYDSNDSIVYRSEELLRCLEEQPYLYRRLEQTVL